MPRNHKDYPDADDILLALDFLAKAEGARGGHIIGHSKSGKPIYAAKGNKRELLHKLGRGENHVAVAASLKHGHYIGMFGADHFKRADRHDQKAAAHFAKAKKADSAKGALKMQKMGQAHADLSRAHRMMGQLSADVRMPDHIREAAQMHRDSAHDKAKLGTTKERYFSGLGQAGHQRALSRHTRLHGAAAEGGQKATAEHHDIMANTHKAILHSVYGHKGEG